MENLDAVLKKHKLTKDEYENILNILGREPNLLEIGIFSSMWSEHCSYKSSKKYLNGFPTKAPWVIQGPGENAGVIDVGDGMAAVFKMESQTTQVLSSLIKVRQPVWVEFSETCLPWVLVLLLT